MRDECISQRFELEDIRLGYEEFRVQNRARLYYVQSIWKYIAKIMQCYHTKTQLLSIVLSNRSMVLRPERLCVECERSSDLVGGLVELLGVKGCAETEGDSWTEENVIGDCGNTTVIDLDLSKRNRIQSVLASNLKPNLITSLAIPSSLSSSLNLAIDLMVIGCCKSAQVVRCRDTGRVHGGRISHRS